MEIKTEYVGTKSNKEENAKKKRERNRMRKSPPKREGRTKHKDSALRPMELSEPECLVPRTACAGLAALQLKTFARGKWVHTPPLENHVR